MWPLKKQEQKEAVEPRYKKGDKVYIYKNDDSDSTQVIEATIIQKSEASGFWPHWIVKMKNGHKYAISQSSIHGKVELDKSI